MGASEAVTAHIEALRRERQLDTQGEALAAIAMRLAELLDVGQPVVMTASWTKELRQTILAMAPKGTPDGDDADSWLDGLSAEVRNPPEP